MISADYWKVLILGYQKVIALNFSVMRNTVSFGEKFNAKKMFTWLFLAFHDIQEPGKYDFLCSGKIKVEQGEIQGEVSVGNW